MRWKGLLALVLGACAPSTMAPPPVVPPPLAEVEVALVDHAFRPDALRIAPGTLVVFKNQGQALHTATEGTGLFDSGILAPGAEFRYAFQVPGAYQIYCKIHPYMTLSLEVRP